MVPIIAMFCCHRSCLPVMREVSERTRSRDTVRFLEQTTPAFISPDLWPPNSPDLNPVDYKIWGIVQQRVYQSRVHDVDQLKQRLLDVWHGMEQSVVDSAIDEWRVRLQACVRAREGHFEQTL